MAGGAVWGAVALGLAWSILTCWYDLKYTRLPNWLTLPLCVVAVIAVAFEPFLSVGMLWPATYLLFGQGIGGGDIKLALPLGVASAAAGGFIGVMAALFISSFCTVCFALLVRSHRVPHGPSMLLASWAVIGIYAGNCIFS